MLYPIFFIARRTFFVIAIHFAPENSGVQIISLSIFTTVFTIYLIQAQPRKMTHFNNVEVINELTTKGIEYFMIAFTDINPNPLVKQEMVVPFMLTVSMLIIFNLLYLIQEQVLKPIVLKKRVKKLKKAIVKQRLSKLKIEKPALVEVQPKRESNLSMGKSPLLLKIEISGFSSPQVRQKSRKNKSPFAPTSNRISILGPNLQRREQSNSLNSSGSSIDKQESVKIENSPRQEVQNIPIPGRHQTIPLRQISFTSAAKKIKRKNSIRSINKTRRKKERVQEPEQLDESQRALNQNYSRRNNADQGQMEQNLRLSNYFGHEDAVSAITRGPNLKKKRVVW